MRVSWLTADLSILPKNFFLTFLLAYPLMAFILVNQNIDALKVLGVMCYLYLLFRIVEIYKRRETLIMPYYVILFGLFSIYTFLSSIFISDYFAARGIKYFYSDPIWLTFIGLIVVENVKFSYNSLKFAKNILVFTLIAASLVSIIQISKPFFFVNDEMFVDGLSLNRFVEYSKNPEIGISKDEQALASRFLKGYRLSIYSYINELSVGIDTIAIFSILIAMKPFKMINQGVVTLTAAIVSFLSSARWIMLGFLIVGSQKIWTGKNKLNNIIKILLLGIGTLILIGIIANIMGMDVAQFMSKRIMSDSFLTRFVAFEVFIEVFPDNPIFGTGGVDTEKMVRLLRGRSSQIHVGFLKLFYYYGITGGLLYLSFLAAFLIRLRKMAKYSDYWGGFFAIIAFFIANITLFELSLFYYGPLLAIIFANHFYYNKMEENTVLMMNESSDQHS